MLGAEYEALIGIAVGAGLGLAIGLERGWKALNEGVEAESGIRTYTLVGLLGGLAGWLQVSHGINAIVPAFVAVTLLTALSYGITVWRGGDAGLTSEFALLVTFGLGSAAGTGYWTAAAGIAVAVALILGLKTEIHGVVRRLDRGELLATLQLLVLAILILPMLPGREVFGLEGFNPRTIGLLALLVSVISYIGYFGVQILGPRIGLLFTAALGGLTSSTAVALSFARLAHDSAGVRAELGAGIALACAVMGPRLLIIVGIVAPSLISQIIWPLLALTLLPISATAWQLYNNRRRFQGPELALKNPLSIGTALIFAAALTLLFILLPVVRDVLGDPGLYALAVLSGATDVDAISLSVARGAVEGSIEGSSAASAIVLAAVANTLVKAGIVLVVSRGSLRFVGAMLITGALAAGIIAVM